MISEERVLEELPNIFWKIFQKKKNPKIFAWEIFKEIVEKIPK